MGQSHAQANRRDTVRGALESPFAVRQAARRDLQGTSRLAQQPSGVAPDRALETAALPTVERQSSGTGGPSRLGLAGILVLLVLLAVILQQKFSGGDAAWAQGEHQSLRSVVLGQSPDQDDEHAAVPQVQRVSSETTLPQWARAEQTAAATAQKQSASGPAARHATGLIQLAGHSTEDPFASRSQVPAEKAEPAPLPGHKANSTRSLPAADMSAAETPRSLFADENASAAPVSRQARPLMPLPVTQERSAAGLPHEGSPAGTLADPFSASSPLPSAAAAGTSPLRAPGHQGESPEGPFPRQESHAVPGGRSSTAPALLIQPTAGTEPAQETSLPEPEPFDVPATPPTPRTAAPEQSGLTTPIELQAHEPVPTPARMPQPRPLMSLDAAEPAPTPRPTLPMDRQPAPRNNPEPRPGPTQGKVAAPTFDTYTQSSKVPSAAAQPLDRVIPANESTREEVYQVQPGDNYWTISRRFYGTARFFAGLAEYNKHRIPQPERMKPGMYVLVPDLNLLQQKYPQLTGGDQGSAEPEQPPGFFVSQDGHPCYRVGQGDTLTEISQRHLGRMSRWVQIYGMNKERIPDPNALKLGTILRLPADACQVVLAPDGAQVR